MSRINADRYKQFHLLYLKNRRKDIDNRLIGNDDAKMTSDQRDNKGTYNNILLLGPNTNIKGVKNNINDTLIVINKITQSSIELGKDVLYVLNMSWGSKNKVLIEEAAHKGQTIYLPEINWLGDLKNHGKIIEYGTIVSKYTIPELGVSPMGLQRALILVLRGYKFEKILLRGFDFGLSKSAYKDWYPSLMRDRNGIENGIKHSYKRHCIRYNFMLTKFLLESISEKCDGTSKIERICRMNLDDFENRIKTRYKLR